MEVQSIFFSDITCEAIYLIFRNLNLSVIYSLMDLGSNIGRTRVWRQQVAAAAAGGASVKGQSTKETTIANWVRGDNL